MESLENIYTKMANLNLTLLLAKIGIIKTLTFYQNYLQAVDQIRLGNSIPVALVKVYAPQFGLCLIAIHYILLYLLDDRLKPTEQVLLFNWLHVNGFPPVFNIFAAIFVLHNVQLICLLYTKNNRILYCLLQSIFLDQCSRRSVSVAVANVMFNFGCKAQSRSFWTYEGTFWRSATHVVNYETFFGLVRLRGVLGLRHLQLLALTIANLLNLLMLMLCEYNF